MECRPVTQMSSWQHICKSEGSGVRLRAEVTHEPWPFGAEIDPSELSWQEARSRGLRTPAISQSSDATCLQEGARLGREAALSGSDNHWKGISSRDSRSSNANSRATWMGTTGSIECNLYVLILMAHVCNRGGGPNAMMEVSTLGKP